MEFHRLVLPKPHHDDLQVEGIRWRQKWLGLIEQTAGKRMTLAADWFTGTHAAAYFTPVCWPKLTSKPTAYTADEIGNSGITGGNHLFLAESDWN